MSGLRVVYVGRLVEEKGVRELVETVLKVRGCSLRIIGAGPERVVLERNFSAQSDRIEFLGQLGAEEVRKQIRMSDVLVLPSRATDFVVEQFGLVLLEAMAEGTAVIASEVGGIPEVVGDCGYLYDQDKPWLLAEILTKLAADDSLLEEFSRRAAARFKEWEPEAVGKRLVAFWEPLLRTDDDSYS